MLKRYQKQKYKYVDLVGFYYVTEETSGSGTLMPDLSAYLHAKGYPFTWIPYYNAPGWNLWKEKGFDFAWYQPNYFFNAWLPEERLVSACKRAIAYGMAMEMEFDERAAADRPESLGERLRGKAPHRLLPVEPRPAYAEIFRESERYGTVSGFLRLRGETAPAKKTVRIKQVTR